MVKKTEPFVTLVAKSSNQIGRRQDAPPVYDLNTLVWVYSRDAIMEMGERLPRRTLLYEVSRQRAIDLDTEFDFQMLEWMMEKDERYKL